jgi:hypothetical protein
MPHANVRSPSGLCCCSFQGKLRVYARGDTGDIVGAIAILVRLPSDDPQVYRTASSVPVDVGHFPPRDSGFIT